jgi:hypothetical protein
MFCDVNICEIHYECKTDKNKVLCYMMLGVWGSAVALQAGSLRVRLPITSLRVFNLVYLSGRTMALGSTQLLTEISSRKDSYKSASFWSFCTEILDSYCYSIFSVASWLCHLVPPRRAYSHYLCASSNNTSDLFFKLQYFFVFLNL